MTSVSAEHVGVDASEARAAPPQASRPAPDARWPSGLQPTAARVLELQRAIGNRATSRRLARQGAPAQPAPSTGAPSADAEDELDRSIAEFERQTEADYQALRARLIAKLTGGIADSMDFTSELRNVDPMNRARLMRDAEFIAAMRHVFGSGEAMWALLLRLQFGTNTPQQVRELSLAIFERDTVAVSNALRAYPMLSSEASTPGVRAVLTNVFAGNPTLPQMLALLDAHETAIANVSTTYGEAHYESSGFLGLGWTLKTFGGTGAYELHRAPGELRVIVSIKLVEEHPGMVSGEMITRWRDGIQRAWNIGYRAVSGGTALRIIFVPMFRFEGPADHTVHVQASVTDDRADESHWSVETSSSTAAHEFGHMIGLADEYRLPATIAEAMSAGLSHDEAMNSSVEGLRIQEAWATGANTYMVPQHERGGTDVAGIMSENRNVQPRHIRPIVNVLNSRLRQAGEAAFHVEGPG